jgi:6-bladed beta-propeller
LLDSEQNFLEKSFPFNSKISNMAWGNTGFLRKTNSEVFLSRAFSDTIFKFKDSHLSPNIIISIQSEKIKEFQHDHRKLLFNKILLDSSASFLGDVFLKNNNYIIFSYQQNKRIKTGIYNIKTKKLAVMPAMVGDDPLISLILTPLYLGNDNTVIFSFSMKDATTLRTQYPDLLNKLSKNNKAILNNTTEKSGAFLLISKIKNDYK